MDTCKICGRKNPVEDANFCYYCGASLRDGEEGLAINASIIRERLGLELGTTATSEEDSAQEAFVPRSDEERMLLEGKPFSKWKWFGTFLLLFIPVYGWIAFLVVMFISAFGTAATSERKEMAKGMLLFLAVFLVFMIITMVQMFNNPEFMEYYNQLMEEAMSSAQ